MIKKKHKRPDLINRNKSLKQRLAVSEAMKKRVVTLETRKKMSQLMMGEKRHLGHKHTEETKKRISQIKIGQITGDKHPQWKGGLPKCIECGKQLAAYGAERCQLHANTKISRERYYSPSEETKEKLRKATIQQLQRGTQKQDTSIELKMKDILDKNGIQYYHPYNFKDKFLCDFAIPTEQIIIECDGDYWHNREDIKKRDKSKNGYVKKCGWTMLRFWEHEINENIDNCFEAIETIRKQ